MPTDPVDGDDPIIENDHHAIAACLLRHNQARDQRDSAALAAVYQPDAVVAFGQEMPAGEWIERICTSAQTLVSYHRTGQARIQIDGAQARSETACIAHVLLPDTGAQRFLCGRYLDRHADRGDGWRIAHRHFVEDWIIDLPLDGGPLATCLLGPRPAAITEPLRALREITAISCVAAASFASDRGDAEIVRGFVDPRVECVLADADGRQFHMLEQLRVDDQGETMIVSSRALMLCRKSAEDNDRIEATRRDDRLQRHGAGWRIVASRIEESWSGDCPSTRLVLPFDKGRADRNDASYAFWHA